MNLPIFFVHMNFSKIILHLNFFFKPVVTNLEYIHSKTPHYCQELFVWLNKSTAFKNFDIENFKIVRKWSKKSYAIKTIMNSFHIKRKKILEFFKNKIKFYNFLIIL